MKLENSRNGKNYMSNSKRKLTKPEIWLLRQGVYLYSGLAGAIIGGAVARSIDTLAEVWNNLYTITLLDIFGTLIICLSGIFLLRISNNVELINRLVHSYIETKINKGSMIDSIKLQDYIREKQEEYGNRVLLYFFCFLICFVIGVLLIIFSHFLGLVC